ncbi:hypothetical protein [uncultured Amphritea sp.]|uniref:hypothetical protein n=2 Tax=Pseudomonadota TaxID=1224 RepID=UPI00261BE2EA|nr:hypothetical protein [uncultured Amphritea sp.]
MSNILTSELIRRLAYGELSNLKMASAGDGTILAADLPKVLLQINNALTELYTKFLLSQKEVVINAQETITQYYLRYEFAQSNLASAQPVLYIDDSSIVNWDGRIVKVLHVYDGFGRELYLNKSQEPLSVFTPQFDCLQITANHQSEDFYVIFQALHPIVNYDTAPDPDTDTLIEDLPPALEKPLELLIASKVYGQMNGEANVTKSAMLHQQYEAKLLEAEFRDTLSTSENTSNSKLERNGFV